MPRKSLASYLLCLLLISAKLFTGLAFAGTSASQWVVVVNGKSKNSLTLANHYCQLRDIPARNVILLKDIPDSNTITIDDFRKLILGPVLQQIESRQLNLHVQGVAYSCDIPTAIDLREDLKSVKDLPKILTPTGSLNGMTYLFRWVQQSDPSYIGPDSNWYATHDASVLLKIYQGSAESIEELRKWINEDGQHEKAAERFDQLRKESANSFPLDFLAAQQWALAGDSKKAIVRLGDAVRKGWKYRGEILNDPSFDALREDKEFQKIVSRCPNEEFKVLPAKAFDARNFFAPNCTESQNPKHGVSYLLSMVLSHTANNRLTIDEAIAHLERSSLADFTNPKGTFYFSKTSDVRTTTREPNFSIAIDELSKLKKDAQIIESVLPPAGSSVAGITFGVSDFDWNRSGAKLIPGSLADNLTSLGGVMTPSSQTKATELLRFGAAAASGTVTEPYALQFKFPLPSLHAYYAKGMTAAEAFYATVQSPYQLLILGDPMCQPFA
ncbi:MAG: TPR end-of-group domain-containing protein, partial [Planctomycetota bacterium]